MIYRLFFRLVLQRVNSERAHSMAIVVMRIWGWIPGALRLTDLLLRPPAALRVSTLGMNFRTPLGVAAGVDKNSTAFDTLAALGFGAVEVGTATNLPQPGNEERPRVWRLPDEEALLNAMGFPNDGAEVQAGRLAKRRTQQVLGVNVGKSRAIEIDGEVVADYCAAARQLAPFADYLALNVSSPNTPGLRDLQAVDHLSELVAGVRAQLEEIDRRLPLLIKIGPDLSNEAISALAGAAQEMGVDGIIAVNTTTDYDKISVCREAIRDAGDRGGVSGKPLKERALEVLELLNDEVENLPLISVGGIENAEDAWQRILSGASLVQAHTGFVYGGPLWPRRLNRGLARLLADSPYESIEEAIGKRPRCTASGTSEDASETVSGLGSRFPTAA